MLPAANRGAGSNLGFPDVCLTPAAPSPIPVPYPNIASNAQASPFCVIVKLTMVNALNMASKIPMTSGDEGGTSHATFKGMGSYTMGNPKIFIEKMPGINLACPTTGNNMNNPVGAVLVPSASKVFYTYRCDAQRDAPTCSSSQRHPCSSVLSLPAIEAHLEETARADVRRTQLDGDVWQLSLSVLARDLPNRLAELVPSSPPEEGGLVLDLRGNPGGELRSALELAGAFLHRGTAIATIVDADGDETVHRARARPLFEGALAILVDGDTASAAELVARSLQAAGRALVFGTPTYGKRSIQRLDGAAYDTVARWRVANEEDMGPVIPDVMTDAREDPVRAALAVFTSRSIRKPSSAS